MNMKRLMEIRRRKLELRDSINELKGEELDNAIKEVEELDKEEATINKEIDDVQENAEQRSKKLSIFNKKETVVENYNAESAEYRSAFFKDLVGYKLNEKEQRAMMTVAENGNKVVPTVTMNKIYEKISNDAVVYSKVSVSHLKGNVVIPYEKTTNDYERKAESESGSKVKDVIDSLVLGAKKYIKLVQISCELEAQAIDALEDFIVDKLASKLVEAFDHDIINGDGVKGCKGILKTLTVKETSGTTWTYDDVCTLFASLPAKAKKNATLMCSTETLYEDIAKIKDENKRPIFDVANGTVLGRKIEEADNMPKGVLMFGNLALYQFNWSKELEIAKSIENAFESGDLTFRGLAVVDGGMLDLNAMVAMQTKQATAQS